MRLRTSTTMRAKQKNIKFNSKWLTDHEWLVFDHENVVMFCKDCRMYAKEKNKTTITWWELIILKSRL